MARAGYCGAQGLPEVSGSITMPPADQRRLTPRVQAQGRILSAGRAVHPISPLFILRLVALLVISISGYAQSSAGGGAVQGTVKGVTTRRCRPETSLIHGEPSRSGTILDGYNPVRRLDSEGILRTRRRPSKDCPPGCNNESVRHPRGSGPAHGMTLCWGSYLQSRGYGLIIRAISRWLLWRRP